MTRSVELPSGELRVLQPAESAELPDDGPVERAPLAPYWSVLWRSGVALAQELAGEPLAGARAVELGCGLALPSIAAARAGATVLATDESPEALELAARNAEANGVRLETAAVDWRAPDELLRARPSTSSSPPTCSTSARASRRCLRSCPPRPRGVAGRPGRPAAGAFMEEARRRRWEVETRERGVVAIHRLGLV